MEISPGKKMKKTPRDSKTGLKQLHFGCGWAVTRRQNKSRFSQQIKKNKQVYG